MMLDKNSLFEAFRRAMMADPSGSEKEAFYRFLDTVREDRQYLELLASDYFERKAAYWNPVEQRFGGHAFVKVASKERQEAVKREFVRIKESIRKTILMDFELPDGTLVRDATGSKMAKAGGFFKEVARHIGASEVVGKKLTEADLSNIRSRYFDSAKKVAA